MRVLGSRNEMIVSGTPEQRIAAIARLQRGRVSHAQLHAIGLSDGAIRRRVCRGSLMREHPSAYFVGHVAPTPLGSETAALLSVREGAALSHHTAAALWGIGPAAPEVHIVVMGGWAGRRAGVHIHRTVVVDARDLRIREGLPVTSPARTLLDQAAVSTARRLEHMFNEALVRKLVRPADIEDVLVRGRGRTGRGLLRALLDDEIDPARLRSGSERRLLALIRQAGLPEPLVNAPLHGFEADLYWPTHRLVVEVDSYGFHTTTWAYERDRRKDAVLRAQGLPPMRFSRRQIRDQPFLVIAQIAGGLAGAGGPPPSTPTQAVRGAAAR